MDLLNELFRDAGVERRLLDTRHVPADRGLRFSCERSVGFHVVLDGTMYVHADALDAPLQLGPGDIAVMGRGCVHVLSSRQRLGRLPIDRLGVADELGPRGAVRPGAARDGAVQVVSGAYQLWHTPVHPFFAELPPWFVRRRVATAGLDPLALTVALLADELRRDDAQPDALGRTSVVHGLFDVLFTYLLREMVAQRGAQGVGWSHAIGDMRVRQAVALMHGNCAHNWTLASLAKASGRSRSVLAERFREAMGATPLAYLRTVRLQRAMRLLAESDRTLEQVAPMVGYRDAFGFSKAFKRAVGVSPGEFRRRDASERGVAWRFAAG